MNKEKLIKKLISKAEEVGEIEIPQSKITEMPLEDFYKAKGKIFYCNNTFYKKTGSDWLKFTPEGDYEAKPTKIDPNPTNSADLEVLRQKIETIEKWIWDFKTYVDDALKEMKEYIDNKARRKICK